MDIKKIIDKAETLSEVAFLIFGKINYTNREKVKKIMLEEGIDWKEWLQTKKDKKKKYCLNCGKELKGCQKKFCSSSCAAKINNIGVLRNKKKKRQCLSCGSDLKRYQKKYCSDFCRKKHQYASYIDSWKKGEESGLAGEFSVSAHIKRYLREKFNNKCQICGWSEVNPFTNKIPLEIHHIDGNYMNNSEDNLQLLCPNCHSLTSTYKAANKNGRKERKKYR